MSPSPQFQSQQGPPYIPTQQGFPQGQQTQWFQDQPPRMQAQGQLGFQTGQQQDYQLRGSGQGTGQTSQGFGQAQGLQPPLQQQQQGEQQQSPTPQQQRPNSQAFTQTPPQQNPQQQQQLQQPQQQQQLQQPQPGSQLWSQLGISGQQPNTGMFPFTDPSNFMGNLPRIPIPIPIPTSQQGGLGSTSGIVSDTITGGADAIAQGIHLCANVASSLLARLMQSAGM